MTLSDREGHLATVFWAKPFSTTYLGKCLTNEKGL